MPGRRMQNLSQDSPLDLLSSSSDKQHSSAMFSYFNEVLYDLSMTSMNSLTQQYYKKRSWHNLGTYLQELKKNIRNLTQDGWSPD
jgi:hypothetical protein